MLKQLTIDNLALIKHLDISFEDSMTCLTGETGAGKSIMLDAIGLVLGGKCSPSLIKSENKSINIIATFSVNKSSQAYNWLAENNLFSENYNSKDKYIDLTITRQITKSSSLKSKATINQHTVNLQQLKQVGQFLIYIHGQHEHLNLLKETNQLNILDNFARHNELKTEVHAICTKWSAATQELLKLQKLQEDQTARKQLLEFQISELEAAELTPNEWDKITKEFEWLSNQQEYITKLNQAYFILQEGDDQQASVSSQLNHIVNLINEINTDNEQIKNIAEFINQSLIQTEEASDELKYFVNNLETDESKISELDNRISTLHDLARKYKTEPENLNQLFQDLQQELDDLSNIDDKLDNLKHHITHLEQDYFTKANILTTQREQAAGKLSKELTSLLKKLRMSDCDLSIFLKPNEDNKPKSHGLESVVFLIKTNAGDTMKPLNKGVSGGELSRVALATQVVTAQIEGTPSLIFDEVDVGIGGGTAEIVGKLLRKMGKTTQVMCITHLAQVASQAKHHIKVSKANVNNETVTSITALNKEQRIEELARMLGGLKITKQTKLHAEELLAEAN